MDKDNCRLAEIEYYSVYSKLVKIGCVNFFLFFDKL